MTGDDIAVTVDEVIESISDPVSREISERILRLFADNGLTYRIKTGYGNVYRIFCYIRKSKEALIINPIGKNFGPFELQMRIKRQDTLDSLELFSPNVVRQILASKDCAGPFCVNCGSEYRFTYKGKPYRKCHMLCDNFVFRRLTDEDIDSVVSIVKSEIDYHSQGRAR